MRVRHGEGADGADGAERVEGWIGHADETREQLMEGNGGGSP